MANLHLLEPSLNLIYDLDNVESALVTLEWKRWFEDVDKLSKLRCYKEFTDRDMFGVLGKGNLKRYGRSLLGKLYCGILPLEVEIGRFTRTKT